VKKQKYVILKLQFWIQKRIVAELFFSVGFVKRFEFRFATLTTSRLRIVYRNSLWFSAKGASASDGQKRPQPDLNRCRRRERAERTNRKHNKLESDSADQPSNPNIHNKLTQNNKKQTPIGFF